MIGGLIASRLTLYDLCTYIINKLVRLYDFYYSLVVKDR